MSYESKLGYALSGGCRGPILQGASTFVDSALPLEIREKMEAEAKVRDAAQKEEQLKLTTVQIAEQLCVQHCIGGQEALGLAIGLVTAAKDFLEK